MQLTNLPKQNLYFFLANANLCLQKHMLRNSLKKYAYKKSCIQLFKSKNVMFFNAKLFC